MQSVPVLRISVFTPNTRLVSRSHMCPADLITPCKAPAPATANKQSVRGARGCLCDTGMNKLQYSVPAVPAAVSCGLADQRSATVTLVDTDKIVEFSSFRSQNKQFCLNKNLYLKLL